MINGMLILWFALTILSILYITYDLIFVTPEAPVMKLGWWLVTLYAGPIGLFFYLLSCKEPMRGTHEAFIAPLWKQSLGSMVHCLAGDVTGIIIAALILAFFSVSMSVEILIEYLAGFGFGLVIFQSLFMKKMMGGKYLKALLSSFYPEFTSMNMIMSAMIPTMVIWNLLEPSAQDPRSLHFWGKMSLATLLAGAAAFRMNRWLVKNGLKHGMMTVRRQKTAPLQTTSSMHEEHKTPTVSAKKKWGMLLLSLAALLIGIIISLIAARVIHPQA